MLFNVGCITDIGKKRSQNQDSMAAIPELGLFMVADGMGGHRGGETASAIATEVIPKSVAESFKTSGWEPRMVIAEAMQQANRAIYQHALKRPELQGMGTTATALLFTNGKLTIGHVGDSRCYFLKPEGIWQATRDHSLVQEKLRAGLITRSEVKTDRMKNVITRSVGFEPVVDVDVYQMNVTIGDTFLICSDGLSGLIEDPEVFRLVKKDLFEQGDINQTVKDLIGTANRNGGDDNITTVMIQVVQLDG